MVMVNKKFSRRTKLIGIFSSIALLVIAVFYASPNRYIEPPRTEQEKQELVRTLQHIYGRIKFIDTETGVITLSYNTSYINRWRPINLPFPQRKGEKTIFLSEETTVLSYRDPEAGYFPLNTFPYSNQEYQDVVEYLLRQDTFQTSLKWQDLEMDQGVTIVSSNKTFSSEDTLPANLIIARDTDYQDMEAIVVPMIYPVIILLISVGIQNLFPGKALIGTLTRLLLTGIAITWYLVTTFLTL